MLCTKKQMTYEEIEVVVNATKDFSLYMYHCIFGITYDKNNIDKYFKSLEQADLHNYVDATLYLAKHYEKKNHKEVMIKYYKHAIELGNCTATYYLGKYYHDNKNYDLMEQYHNRAIDLGFMDGANALGYYYFNLKRYDLTIYYYMLGVNKDNVCSMYNLGLVFKHLQMHDLSTIHFGKAVDKGHVNAMWEMINFYTHKNRELKIKYLKMACEKNDIKAVKEIVTYYYDEMKKSPIDNTDVYKKYLLQGCLLYNQEIVDRMNSYLKNESNWDVPWINQVYSLLDGSNLKRLNSYIIKLLNIRDICKTQGTSLDQMMTYHKEFKKRKLDLINLDPLEFYEQLQHILEKNNGYGPPLMSQFECQKCTNVRECVYLKCGHSICYICFDNFDKCKFVNNTKKYYTNNI